MATIILELSDEMEKKLAALAQEQTRSVAAAAHEILKIALYDPETTANPNDLPYEIWRERFETWVNSHQKIAVDLDDSRETIYEGR